MNSCWKYFLHSFSAILAVFYWTRNKRVEELFPLNQFLNFLELEFEQKSLEGNVNFLSNFKERKSFFFCKISFKLSFFNKLSYLKEVLAVFDSRQLKLYRMGWRKPSGLNQPSFFYWNSAKCILLELLNFKFTTDPFISQVPFKKILNTIIVLNKQKRKHVELRIVIQCTHLYAIQCIVSFHVRNCLKCIRGFHFLHFFKRKHFYD